MTYSSAPVHTIDQSAGWILAITALFIFSLPATAAPTNHLPLLKKLTTGGVVLDDNFGNYVVPGSPSALNKPTSASALGSPLMMDFRFYPPSFSSKTEILFNSF